MLADMTGFPFVITLINGPSYHMIRFHKLKDLLFSMFNIKAYIASYGCT